MLIDTHCHLDRFIKKGELDNVLARAEEAGVSRLITIGTNQEDWPLYKALVAKHPGRIDYTVGLHPSDVEEDWNDQVTLISTYFIDAPLPVAIGEIGLDYFRLPKFPDEAAEIKQRQQAAFHRQLELAVQFDVPVVVHSRAAFADCVAAIDQSAMDWSRVVFHCFGDGADEMQVLMERGARGSFTGIATYKNAEPTREALLAQGIGKLMLETDAPYLAPEPMRGKPCEPAFVRHTAAFCAGILGMTMDELCETTTANAMDFFGLK